MKPLLFFCFATCWTTIAFAQNIGIGTTTPAASALLDISSTTRGLLAPRMTTAQRNAIATPAKGLLVYDTDLNGLHHFNGTSWTAVGGGGGIALPYSGSVSNASPALRIINIGAGEAISGSSTSSFTAAIEGTANGTGGYGVVGNSSSASGYGIYGTNPTGTAVYGFSVNGGVALRGNSPTGLALLTNGNLRLTGGNTNPSKGAVLTSVDNNGNAVWKQSNIGFCVRLPENEAIPPNVNVKVEFSLEDYDLGNNFIPYSGSTTAGSSKFTAPVAGVYNFISQVTLRIVSPIDNFTEGYLSLIINGNTHSYVIGNPYNILGYSYVQLALNVNVRLKVGDTVWLAVSQDNDDSDPEGFINQKETGLFSGTLLFAD